VLHGGGNTSVKLVIKNKVNEDVEVIAVKGSGWDLSNIEPEGFPMIDLIHCRKLLALDELSDSDMVNELRTHMMDSNSPNPSVETLLHAFLPHKVDLS
jgi:rhamnose utilization protein RhaD (predicted bifunctional aldolase and dehydrogenase)